MGRRKSKTRGIRGQEEIGEINWPIGPDSSPHPAFLTLFPNPLRFCVHSPCARSFGAIRDRINEIPHYGAAAARSGRSDGGRPSAEASSQLVWWTSRASRSSFSYSLFP